MIPRAIQEPFVRRRSASFEERRYCTIVMLVHIGAVDGFWCIHSASTVQPYKLSKLVCQRRGFPYGSWMNAVQELCHHQSRCWDWSPSYHSQMFGLIKIAMLSYSGLVSVVFDKIVEACLPMNKSDLEVTGNCNLTQHCPHSKAPGSR